jgi:phenylacetate-coenzyme A ligase PaaK-like adenylate-forming protein
MDDIFRSDVDFNHVALETFNLQAKENKVYCQYLQYLNIRTEQVADIHQIPFLPIRFFKSFDIITGLPVSNAIHFTSSGTTGDIPSKHMVSDITLYEQSFTAAFNHFYGDVGQWCILALLPSYLERQGSSLVYMCDRLIRLSNHPQSGFYLHNYAKLYETLKHLEAQKQKTLLIGVSYALLDLAEQFPLSLQHTIVMETGGMKGKRPEMVKAELHEVLKNAFHTDAIHSEYGMTELLSQAYSKGSGVYYCPPWMKILIRDSNDPLSLNQTSKAGGINVIDLANRHSCSFIATQDMGKIYEDGSFEIAGRFDDSEIRGCNLMVE